MPRRPLLAAVTLSTLTLLTACHGSPEAGRPNTTPPSSPASTPTANPTTTAPSTPAWTPQEDAAIAAAKARYIAATAAVDKAFGSPSALDRSDLEKAGIGGEWIIDVIDQARSFSRSRWYQTGRTRIVSTTVTSVNLKAKQPEIDLANCLDTSQLIIRFSKDDKPVPMGPGNGNRHRLASRLVYAPPAQGGQKMWFLISDKVSGTC